MKPKMTFHIWVLLAGSLFAQQPPPGPSAARQAPDAAPVYSETKLAVLRPDGTGAFSPYWVGYLISPEKGDSDQNSYVELNGKKLGPYSNVSSWIRISPDRRHIAFAAEKGGLWKLVVDGVEKYSAKKLYWADASWGPGLRNNVFSNEVSAAVFDFFPGNAFAYLAEGEDGLDRVFVNGVPGPGFGGFSQHLAWAHGALLATGFTKDKPVEIHGSKQFGPYDSVSYEKISDDEEHYAVRVTTNGVGRILYDDKIIESKGPVADFELGPHGELAYTYKDGGLTRVVFNGREIPDAYQYVNYLAISPDGKNLAFWAKKGQAWTVVAGDRTFPSARGFYYYVAGDEYALMWSRDSEHVLYYVRGGGRSNDGTSMLDGKALGRSYGPTGMMVMSIIQDENGEICGEQMMGGASLDRQAMVEAALLEGKTACVPESSVITGQKLSCIVRPGKTGVAGTDKSGQPERVFYGDKEEGPYKAVRSTLSATKDGKHYAYVVETDQGWQIVVDGSIRPQVYEEVFRTFLNEKDSTYEVLASRGGSLYHVIQRIPN